MWHWGYFHKRFTFCPSSHPRVYIPYSGSQLDVDYVFFMSFQLNSICIYTMHHLASSLFCNCHCPDEIIPMPFTAAFHLKHSMKESERYWESQISAVGTDQMWQVRKHTARWLRLKEIHLHTMHPLWLKRVSFWDSLISMQDSSLNDEGRRTLDVLPSWIIPCGGGQRRLYICQGTLTEFSPTVK